MSSVYSCFQAFKQFLLLWMHLSAYSKLVHTLKASLSHISSVTTFSDGSLLRISLKFTTANTLQFCSWFIFLLFHVCESFQAGYELLEFQPELTGKTSYWTWVCSKALRKENLDRKRDEKKMEPKDAKWKWICLCSGRRESVVAA